MSAEQENEYFVDGLTDEIIRNLSIDRGPGSAVADLIVRFQGQASQHPRNRRELKVNWVVEGTVLATAGKLRVNAQFVARGRRRSSLERPF